jgi:hypothetical protein
LVEPPLKVPAAGEAANAVETDKAVIAITMAKRNATGSWRALMNGISYIELVLLYLTESSF